MSTTPTAARTGQQVLESIESLLSQKITTSQPRKRESESLLELYKALAAAQKGFSDVQKTGRVSVRNYSYATINDLVEASRAALRTNNLVCNTFIIMENGIEVLVSRLFHVSSGQFMESELPLLINNDEQKRGSSITYAWRYTYAPLLGLVDNSYDDDGVVVAQPTFKK